jgi:hypothetical protein
MKNLEENFLSAVAVVHNDEQEVSERLTALRNLLAGRFKYFEIIVVDNYSKDGTADKLNALGFPVTVVTLANLHNTQSALTAGVEFAVGDYILEIPCLSADVSFDYIGKMYETCQQGNDFIFLAPVKMENASKLFYWLLNGYFKGQISDKFVSSLMTLSSRRGQNKTADVGVKLVNRNVSYVLTGLKCAVVQSETASRNNRSFSENINLMLDTLIFHTDYISRFTTRIALFFFGMSVLAVVYSLVMFLSINTTPGWASTFILIAVSFGVLFALLAIICKYLSNLIKQQQPKTYTFSSVEKRGGK